MDIGSNCHCRLLHVSSKFRSSVAHMHTVSQSPKKQRHLHFQAASYPKFWSYSEEFSVGIAQHIHTSPVPKPLMVSSTRIPSCFHKFMQVRLHCVWWTLHKQEEQVIEISPFYATSGLQTQHESFCVCPTSFHQWNTADSCLI